MIRHTFRKEERLTNKKKVELLFSEGKTFTVFPFRVIWMETKPKSIYPAQLGISVPKKSFSKSVHRNKIKRRIREAYRKNKHILYEILQKKNLPITMMLVYTAKEELPYSEIEKKMLVSLHKLIATVQ